MNHCPCCNCAGNHRPQQQAGNIAPGAAMAQQRQAFGDGILSMSGDGVALHGAAYLDFNTDALRYKSTERRSPLGPEGGKETASKPAVWSGAFQSFPLALTEVARCTMNGLRVSGHTLHRWKEVPDGFKVYSEAHGRHVLREAQATSPDEVFEEVVTVAWNALARLEHLCLERDKENRGD